MTRIACFLAVASLSVFSLTGCTSFSFPRPGNWSSKDSVDRQPVRCLCLWQPVTTEDASGQPVRGFGGQVYFFTTDSEEPIEVDGAVRVYVFDDNGTPTQQTRPKGVQDYDPLIWKSFRENSQFGTNYTLFVPYEHASKYEAICSLRLRLVRPDGTQMFSDMATVKLAGEPREDKSVRQLVSPREQSIRPDRSRDLQVDLQQHRPSNDRAATIGSIQEGSLSLSGNDATSDRILDDQARLQIQRYEAKLANMHAAFEQNDDRQQRSAASLKQDISDLMPAIQEVSRKNLKSHQRVTPAAHEVFSAEEPRQIEPAGFHKDRSQSAMWIDDASRLDSRPADTSGSQSKIHSLSRPLRRVENQGFVPERSEESGLQALQLARIADR